MTRIQLHAVGQQFRKDRGRGHRHDAAQSETARPPQPGDFSDQQNQYHRAEYLRRSKAEDNALHAEQARQGEFETDREHQENDTELREVARATTFRHQIQRMRPDRRAHHQVTEHRRQVEAAKKRHHEDRGGKQQQDQFERIDHQIIYRRCSTSSACRAGTRGVPLLYFRA